MKESHLRSIIKSMSWRVFATLTTTIISYIITHKIMFALYIGALEFFSKIALYYAHERIWGRISLGIKEPKDNLELVTD